MAPQLGNCRKCGKLFLRIREICDECYQKQEEDYIKAADYLREFPGSTIQELSDATGVTVGQIREFIIAERLVAGFFPNLAYPCETCGTMIRAGKKCSNCMDNLNKLAMQFEKKETDKAKQKAEKSGWYISRNL